MLKVLYTHVKGTLTADIASGLTLLPVDIDTYSKVVAAVNFGADEWTYLSLDNGVYSEEVKITGVSGSYLVAERGVSGSTPQAFAALDTLVRDVIGVDAIEDIIASNPAPSELVVTASGIAEADTPAPNAVNINVTQPAFAGDDNIEVLGTWPNIQITLRQDAGGCCPGEGNTGGNGTGVSELDINSTILQGSILGNLLSLVLQAPVFEGEGSVSVSGVWPNYTISGAPGGGGSVTSVAVGTGLSLTGNPAVNPSIAIQNTGVTAGTYGGVVINARGQIVEVPVGFDPISDIDVPVGATVGRVGGTVTINLDSADVGVPGLVELADSAAPLNPTDDSSAVTPALLAAVVAGSVTTDVAAGSGTGEADALYVDALAGTLNTLALAAGEKALIIASVQVLDGTTPLAPVAYGIAVFDDGPVKRASSKICTQSQQTLMGIITGPLASTNLTVVTTALPAGSTVQAAHLAILKL